MPLSREEDFFFFLEDHQFYTFYPKITFPLAGRSYNLQFLVSLYPSDATYQIWMPRVTVGVAL